MSFKRLKNLSAWRKLSLATWGRPSDPSVYAQFDFEATPALQVLEKINSELAQKYKSSAQIPPKVSMTHLVAKGIALTLAKYPSLNGIIRWRQIYLRDTVDIFLQVAIPNEADPLRDHLSGAKVSSVDKKSLEEIAQALSGQAHAIRQSQDPIFQKTFNLTRILPLSILRYLVQLHEFIVFDLGVQWPALGFVADPFGSAMVTSVGMLGLPPGFAPLVPPSRCPLLLCVGAVQMKPWAVDSTTVAVRPVVGIAFTADHRFIDGYMASRMFKFFKDFMDDPAPHLGEYAAPSMASKAR